MQRNQHVLALLLSLGVAFGVHAQAKERAFAEVDRLAEAVRASCVAATRTPGDERQILAAIPKVAFATARSRDWGAGGVSFELQRPPNVTLAQLALRLGSWTTLVGDHGRILRPQLLNPLPPGEQALEAQFASRLRGVDGRECSLWARYVSEPARDKPVVELEIHVALR